MVVKEMRRQSHGVSIGAAAPTNKEFDSDSGNLTANCRREPRLPIEGESLLEEHQSRVDNEIPSWCAFTAVAPMVRFSALEILATPIFFLARDLNSRTSEAVHERRTVFFFLAGIIGSLVEGSRLLTQLPYLAMPTCRANARQH
jgi:hypothetical protein